MAETTAAEDRKFFLLGKELAHTDKSIRDKAVEKIRSEIASIKEATELEMMKLWKGLFYTFWMSDKPDVQEELAISLSKMIPEFRTDSLSLAYIRCFWKTLIREWGGIDRYRMDKYMLLVRKIMDQTFLFLDNKKWRSSVVEEYSSILLNHLANTDYVGVCAHFSDCFLEELQATLPHISTPHFLLLLDPLLTILKQKKNPLILNTIRDRVFSGLVTEYETKREKGEAQELPAFENIDIRFIHQQLLILAFSKDAMSENTRKVFTDLELEFETRATERFDEIDVEKIAQPVEEKEEEVKKEKKEKVVKKEKAGKKKAKKTK